jgi:hypothetical protein
MVGVAMAAILLVGCGSNDDGAGDASLADASHLPDGRGAHARLFVRERRVELHPTAVQLSQVSTLLAQARCGHVVAEVRRGLLETHGEHGGELGSRGATGDVNE